MNAVYATYASAAVICNCLSFLVLSYLISHYSCLAFSLFLFLFLRNPFLEISIWLCKIFWWDNTLTSVTFFVQCIISFLNAFFTMHPSCILPAVHPFLVIGTRPFYGIRVMMHLVVHKVYLFHHLHFSVLENTIKGLDTLHFAYIRMHV